MLSFSIFMEVLADLWRISTFLGHIFKYFSFDSHSAADRFEFLSFLEEWQTLAAGLLAFFPAFAAAVFVWRQLDEQRSQFVQLRKNEELKSRLRLSRNLFQISAHFDKSYELLLGGNFDLSKHTISIDILDDVLNSSVINTKENFNFFRIYIETIQMFSSFCAKYNDFKKEEDMILCFKMLALSDAMTDRIYPFARFYTDKIDNSEISKEDIKRYLLNNLRRNRDISNTNLDQLIKLGSFDGT